MDLANNLRLRSSFSRLRSFSSPKPFANPSSSVLFTRKQRYNICSKAAAATTTVEKESLAAEMQNDIKSLLDDDAYWLEEFPPVARSVVKADMPS